MALWDNLNKKVTETTGKAAQQARIWSETSRLNSLISDEESKVSNSYCQIGKLYIRIHQNSCEEEFADLAASIAKSEEKIKQYRKQIQDIKGVVRCEKCGAEVAKGVAFCSSCGAPIPKVEKADDSVRCENCGTMVKPGARFCTSCGKPMTAPVMVDALPAEVTEESGSGRLCPKCGAKAEADTLFCTECGAKLDA